MEKRRILIALVLGASCLGVMSTATAKLEHKTISQQEMNQAELGLKGNESILYFGGLQTDALSLASRLPQGLLVQQDVIKDVNTHGLPANIKTSQQASNQKFDKVLIQDGFIKHSRQKTLLKELNDQLKPEGKMALTIPDYKQGPIARALAQTWVELEDQVFGSPNYVMYSPQQYTKMLESVGIQVDHQAVNHVQKSFSNKENMLSWLKTHWPYFQEIHAKDKQLFLSTFIEQYLEVTNQSAQGPIVWEQDYIELQGTKQVA